MVPNISVGCRLCCGFKAYYTEHTLLHALGCMYSRACNKVHIYCTLRECIKGTARSFFLRTELHARESAVFGFIPNSCCVEGCFMAYLALFDDPIEH